MLVRSSIDTEQTCIPCKLFLYDVVLRGRKTVLTSVLQASSDALHG
jgi:hypothetical protein